jgi:hypothetical protein
MFSNPRVNLGWFKPDTAPYFQERQAVAAQLPQRVTAELQSRYQLCFAYIIHGYDSLGEA